jgi:peptidoglycan/xylan/chitin deacetylase (PgdA/CDA1 family)
MVLVWHNVESTWSWPSPPGAGARGLAVQLRWLKRQANVIDLADALDMLSEGHELPPRAVAISFDDGYRDNLDLAAPMLNDLALPATFFLAPAFLSGTATPWWEVISHAIDGARRDVVTLDNETFPVKHRRSREQLMDRLKLGDHESRVRWVDDLVDQLTDGQPGDVQLAQDLMLTWSGAHQLVESGFAIGSHSMEHRILAREDPDVQLKDLCLSRRSLIEQLNVPVRMLAYPNGTAQDFNEVTECAARDAGYSHAMTTVRGFNTSATPQYRIRRFVLEAERGLTAFAALLAGVLRGDGFDGPRAMRRKGTSTGRP